MGQALLPLQAIGIGALVGLGLGFTGSSALRASYHRGWTEGTWLQIPVITLSLLCFALAQWLGGSGFIASFVGGMTFGVLTQKHKEAILEPAEGTGDTLALLTWFTFGTLLFVPPFLSLDWRVFVYAVASLTVVRILPIFFSLASLGLRTDTKLFVGWFGPRGLASIVFAVMVAHDKLPGGDTLIAAATLTIVLSVLAHGLTANPLSKAYGARVGDADI